MHNSMPILFSGNMGKARKFIRKMFLEKYIKFFKVQIYAEKYTKVSDVSKCILLRDVFNLQAMVLRKILKESFI